MIPCGNEDNIVMQNRFKLSFCHSKNAQIHNAKFKNFQHLGTGTAPPQTPPHADPWILTVMEISYFTPCIYYIAFKAVKDNLN